MYRNAHQFDTSLSCLIQFVSSLPVLKNSRMFLMATDVLLPGDIEEMREIYFSFRAEREAATEKSGKKNSPVEVWVYIRCSAAKCNVV